MDHYCAPQWVDFLSSPQVPSDDYFEKYHEIYEPTICKVSTNNIKRKKKNVSEIIETPKKSIHLQDENLMKSRANLTENYEGQINSIKNTPIKVIYPLKFHSGKSEVVKQATYDNVLHEAMQNFQICETLNEVKKEVNLSSAEDVFKKPMLIKNKISKPVLVRELDKSNISLLSNTEIPNVTKGLLDEGTKNVSLNVVKTKPNNSLLLSKKNITKISHIKEHSKINAKDDAIKDSQSKIMVGNNNAKSKCSTIKQQADTVKTGLYKKSNLFGRSLTSHKYIDKEESKSKVMGNNQSKAEIIKHNSANSATSQKEISLKATTKLKLKQTPISSLSSINKQERTMCQQNIKLKKIISSVVDSTGPEIIMKKEKILFFDIPIHTKQKKVTCPVPFSFENRDKIKKQLKVNQSESRSIKSESITDTKSISDLNKTEKARKKFGNFTRKGITSLCNDRVMNEKNKDIKQFETNVKNNTPCMNGVTLRKPTKTITALKDNIHEKNKNITEKKKIEDIRNKNSTNQEQRSLKFLSRKNVHISQHSKIKPKQISNIDEKKKEQEEQKKDKLEKENKQPNANMFIIKKSNLHQNKEIKLRSTLIDKRRKFEESMKQKKIMHEEKLKKEREEKLAKEKLEIAEFRKQTEIKARPMPVYKPLIHIKSTKPLTKPQSPAWSTKHKVATTKETS